MAGVYWQGSNGNYYLKAAGFDGVQDMGRSPIGIPTGLRQIADPNAPSRAPAGGSAPAHAPLNTGAVQNTQLAIDQIPSLLAAALASEAQNHTNTVAQMDAQQKQQQGQYDASTTTNQQNYDSNFMDSIRAGIHGLGGLMALLRGTGAAGGTADKQVQDVVGGVTSNDIRSGADTQKANQGQLDSVLSQFLTELKGKRQVNEDTFTNNERAIQRDSATQLQDLYSKLAGYYGDAGDTGNAAKYMATAGGFTPQIAANSMTRTSAYDTAPVAVKAPQLTAFAAPAQPNLAAVPKDGQVGSGIFTINKRKDETTPAPAVPVAAAQGA